MGMCTGPQVPDKFNIQILPLGIKSLQLRTGYIWFFLHGDDTCTPESHK